MAMIKMSELHPDTLILNHSMGYVTVVFEVRQRISKPNNQQSRWTIYSVPDGEDKELNGCRIDIEN